MLAKAFGATVIATAGSDEKCEACRSLGADLAINYRRTDFQQAAKAFAGEQGIDVIIDIVGGDYIPKELDLLKREGRLVFIAQQAGGRVEADFYQIIIKHLTVTGSTLRSRTVAEKGAICRELERHAWPLFADGRLKPVVHRVYPLAEAAQAHALLESNAHIGKILLRP
jgi:NADPH2:quinone reductase